MADAAPQVDDPALETQTGGAFGTKAVGWETFEFARNPYYNVIVIAVFAAYYSSTVVGESTMGQILAGSMIAAAG
ncbi:MAG: hypothetical protein AAGJ50_01570, partial [Pseudomonadota bacterium]